MRITKYRMENEPRTRKPMLVKEYAVNYSGSDSLSSPQEIYWAMNDIFRLPHEAEEHMYMITMNGTLKCTGVFEISHGTDRITCASIRSLLSRALLNNAASIVIMHNHPSGSLKPSQEDIDLTRKAALGCMITEISLLDHIIMSSEGYYSFAEQGEMKEINEWVEKKGDII